MRLKDIFEENDKQVDDEITQLKKAISNAEKEMEFADNRTADQNRIREMQKQLNALQRQKDLATGKTIYEKFVFPTSVAMKLQIHKKLSDMWKVKSGSDYPWRTYGGEQPNTIEYVVQGNPEHRHGGASVFELVEFLRKLKAEQGE